MSDTTTVRVSSDLTTVITTGSIGPPGPRGDTGPAGEPGAPASLINQAVFVIDGAIVVNVGNSRYRIIGSQTVAGVYISIGTAPVGADLIVDVNLNGSTIFTVTGDRPKIPDGFNVSGFAVPSVTDLSDGDYITIDVDQVGSTTPGSDLTVQVIFV